jgi:hypothetical protein
MVSIDIENLAATYTEDFLTAVPQPIFDLVITNHPYGKALEFAQQAFRFRKSERSVVALLLRLNWLASIRRSEWLRANVPTISSRGGREKRDRSV